MTPEDAYMVYMTIKIQYSQRYDFGKYGWCRKFRRDLENQNGKYKFKKLAGMFKDKESLAVCLSSMYVRRGTNSEWIGDLIDQPDTLKEFYHLHTRYMDRVDVNFKQDIITLLNRARQCGVKKKLINLLAATATPIAFEMMVSGDISPETIIFLNEFIGRPMDKFEYQGILPNIVKERLLCFEEHMLNVSETALYKMRAMVSPSTV